jgi:O-antigen/teichoic acid export membrane protein
VDGTLLRWAGRDLDFIGREMGAALRFLLYEQLIIILPVSLLVYLLLPSPLNWLWSMILLYGFIINITTFFLCAAQAVKMFTILSITNVVRNMIFLVLILTLIALGRFDYSNIIYCFSAVFILTLLFFILYFRRYLGGAWPITSGLWAYGRKNIDAGVFILLGNFILVFFFSVDKFVVSINYSLGQFAIYAFASGILLTIYVFVRAIAEVVFPYLSGAGPVLRSDAYHLGGVIIILAWGAVLAVYFPFSWFVKQYLGIYSGSLPLIQILFCSIVFGSLIQILHVNYFRTYNKQRHYFLFGLVALIGTTILIFLSMKIWGDLRGIAIGMVCGCFLWYLLNERSLKTVIAEQKMKTGKFILAIFSYIAAYWLVTIFFDSVYIQTGLYLCLFALISWLFFRYQVKELLLIAASLGKTQVAEQ